MNSCFIIILFVFCIEQDNVVQVIIIFISGSNGEFVWKFIDGMVSKGVEFEVNGVIIDNWQMIFGVIWYVVEDNEGNVVNFNFLCISVKLFICYCLLVILELMVGGGVNWQNWVYKDIMMMYGIFCVEQGSYVLVDLFICYQVMKNFFVQGNINNLFDKIYDINIDGFIVYGVLCNVSFIVNYQF